MTIQKPGIEPGFLIRVGFGLLITHREIRGIPDPAL
jgi:hypothetical protein